MSGHLLKRSTTGHLIRIPFGGLVGGHLGRSGREAQSASCKPWPAFAHDMEMEWEYTGTVTDEFGYEAAQWKNTAPSPATMRSGLCTAYETFAHNALYASVEYYTSSNRALYSLTSLGIHSYGSVFFSTWPSAHNRIAAFRVEGLSETVTAALFVAFCKFETKGSAGARHTYYQFRAPQTVDALMTNGRQGVSSPFVIQGPFYRQTEAEADLPAGVINGTIFSPPASKVVIGLVIVPNDFTPPIIYPWGGTVETIVGHTPTDQGIAANWGEAEISSVTITPLL